MGAGLAMYFILLYLLNFINFIILIPVGALVYFIVLSLFKGFTKEDLSIIRQSFKRT